MALSPDLPLKLNERAARSLDVQTVQISRSLESYPSLYPTVAAWVSTGDYKAVNFLMGRLVYPRITINITETAGLKVWLARITIVALAAACPAMHVAVADTPSQSKFDPDVFGIGINFDEICDLHSGAPIADKCYGFIGAVVEIAKTQSAMEPPFRSGPKTCIPKGPTIAEIFEKIRPSLRVRVCAGFCTQTGYVISALHEAYPCKNEERGTP